MLHYIATAKWQDMLGLVETPRNKNHTSATLVLNLQIDLIKLLLQKIRSNCTASSCSRRFNNDQAISATVSSLVSSIDQS